MARVRNIMRWLPARLGYRLGPRLASWLRKRWLLLRHPHVDISFGKDVYLGPGFSLHAPDGGTLIVGRGVEFRRGVRLELGGNGRLTIGDGSYLTYYTVIACSTSIEIGERVGIGLSCSVYDGNHRIRDHTKPLLAQGYDYRPIRIEDDASIFSLCTVTNSIGRGARIGAGSVVTKPIPDFTIAVGSPAKPIEYFGPEESRPPEPAAAR